MDGLSANDDAAGLSGLPYGVDAVEQFQVVSSGGQAELGRALGGYVNVVTRSGTNQLRGTAYGFFRDDALNAPNALSGTTLPMAQQQYGASVGGPIRRGRTFYFVNAEQRRLDQSGFATISAANLATVNARLAATGYPGQAIATGIFETPIDSVHLLGKIDHAFTGRDQLSVRYSLYDVASENSRGAGGLSAPSASAGIDNRDQAVSVSNTLTLGARTVNETRAQFTYSDLLALPADPFGPAVNIAGVASFGTFPSSPQGRLNTMVQVVNTVAQQRGAHALRAGVDVIHNDDTITFPRAVRGSYAFSSLANFLAGTYNNAGFTQTFGDTVVQQGSTSLGLYAQDEWSATPRLTLNLGLRYDLQQLETVDTDTNNVSPRAGFAWTPFDSRELVVRGSAGLYFDRVPLRALANALLSADNTTDLAKLRQRNIALTPGQAGAPVFPGILPAPVPSVTLFTLTTMQRDLQNAYSRQASLEVERQIGRFGTASAGYSYLQRAQPDDADQPERAVVRGRRHQQRLPADCRLRQQQPVPVGGRARPTTRCCCRLRGGPARVGLLPGQLHAVEGREQRRRVLLQRAHRSVRSRQGLEPRRQRSPAHVRVLGRAQLADDAGHDGVAAPHARLPGEHAAAGLFGGAVQHHLRR